MTTSNSFLICFFTNSSYKSTYLYRTVNFALIFASHMNCPQRAVPEGWKVRRRSWLLSRAAGGGKPGGRSPPQGVGGWPPPPLTPISNSQ